MPINSIPWDGGTIRKPGCYADVPLAVYHGQDILAGPSVSSSGLRRALECNGGSPAHFFAEWSGNPQCVESEDKQHFVLGRAAHHLMLGVPHFKRDFIIRPDECPDANGELKPWSGRMNSAKKWLADARATGRTVLSTGDVETIKQIAMALGRDCYVRSGILNGAIERSIFWRDEETGIWLKVRPDAIPTDSGDFADLKTTTSVHYHDLMFAVTDFAYHQQAALVREGATRVLGVDPNDFSFTLVFVTKRSPFVTRCVMLKPADVDLGHEQNHAALRLVARCMESGRWPGPGDGHIVNLDLAERYRERASEDLAEFKQGEPR